MKEIYKRLEQWRLERGLDKSQGFEFNLDTQVSFLTEEITEYLRANDDYERIDALCDLTVFSINGNSLLDEVEITTIYKNKDDVYNIRQLLSICSSMLDINNFLSINYHYKRIIDTCKHIIEQNIFDFDKCMDETLKEIESRKGEVNPLTGKWEKFKDDCHKSLWYKADYSICKIKAQGGLLR